MINLQTCQSGSLTVLDNNPMDDPENWPLVIKMGIYYDEEILEYVDWVCEMPPATTHPCSTEISVCEAGS